MDYNNMEESPINERRRMYRVELRKNQLESYFQKRRYEMLVVARIENNQEVQDEEKCDFIVKLIDQFSIDHLIALLGKIVDIDPTLSLFCRLTGYSAYSPPLYFQDILTKMQGFPFVEREIAMEEDFQERVLSRKEKQSLRLVCEEFRTYWKAQSKQYINIISLLKRVDNIDCMINQTIIKFLSVMVNILLLFRKGASIAGVSFTIRTLVGEEIFLNYEINSTINILLNLLTGKDELLVPFMNLILETNGCNIEQLELYYNMFLVKQVEPQFTIKLFQYYVRLLENQREFFLSEYRRAIYIIYAAIKVCPTFYKSNDIDNFVIVGEKMIKLLGGLLMIINMRYDNSRINIQKFTSENEDNSFLANLASILESLATNPSLARSIMQEKSVVLFILNHIALTHREIEQKVLSSCLQILISAARDHHSIHFFLNEQPRFLIKVQMLFDKYLSFDIKTLSVLENDSLQNLIYLMIDLAETKKVAEKFVESNMLHKMALMYFRSDGSTARGRELKQSAEIFFLRLVHYLKSNVEAQSFYQFLFNSREVCLMMTGIIKYAPQRKQTVLQGLKLIAYIAYSCAEVPQFQIVKQFLLQSTLLPQLGQLQQSEIDNISQRADNTIKLINMLRNVLQGQYHSQDGQEL